MSDQARSLDRGLEDRPKDFFLDGKKMTTLAYCEGWTALNHLQHTRTDLHGKTVVEMGNCPFLMEVFFGIKA